MVSEVSCARSIIKSFFCSCSLKYHPSFRPTPLFRLPFLRSSGDSDFFSQLFICFWHDKWIPEGKSGHFYSTTRLTHSSNANLIGTGKSFYIKKSSTATGQPHFVISSWSSCFCFLFETKYISQSQQNCDSLGRCFLKHSQHFYQVSQFPHLIFLVHEFFIMDLFASYNSVVSQSSVRFITIIINLRAIQNF